ncbi:MAG: cyclase family protein [Planctomycetota bacterium]|jgi:kynurenine formamidase
MNCDELGKSLSGFRVVDLSKRVLPGQVSGPVGLGPRKYEIKPFTFPPGEIMHTIEMENHISTHVEAPSHFMGPRHGRKGMDVSELPLETFFGPAVFVDLSGSGKGEEVLPSLVEGAGVRRRDIVLFGNAGHEGQERPYLGQAVARYLADLPVKMVGIDDSVFPENPAIAFKEIEQYYIHDYLLSKDIPLIEGLVNLEALGITRFIFFGIPAAMGGLDSFPVRAMGFV